MFKRRAISSRKRVSYSSSRVADGTSCLYAHLHVNRCRHLHAYVLATMIATMTRIIATALAKGGVGKTTTSVNLAAGLAQHGKRVLVIDTDTQGQVSHALGISPTKGLYEYVQGEATAGETLVEARDNLFVLAGGRNLALLEKEVTIKQFRIEWVLHDALSPLNEYFNYIIIDTPPAWGVLAVNTFAYAQELLCPVTLEMLAVKGLIDFIDRVGPIIASTGAELRYVLPTMQDRRVAQTGEILEDLQSTFGARLCAPIRENVRLSEAGGHGQHIFEYAPTSNGANDYRKLTERILADE